MVERCVTKTDDPDHHTLDGLLTLNVFPECLHLQHWGSITQGTLKNTLLSKRAVEGHLFKAEATAMSLTSPPVCIKQPSRNTGARNAHLEAMPLVGIGVHRSPLLHAVELHQESKKEAATYPTMKHLHSGRHQLSRENKKKHNNELVPTTVSLISSPDNSSHHATQKSTALTARVTLFRYTRAPSSRAARVFFAFLRILDHKIQPICQNGYLAPVITCSLTIGRC